MTLELDLGALAPAQLIVAYADQISRWLNKSYLVCSLSVVHVCSYVAYDV